MNADELKALQAPVKERYRSDPESASVTLAATGQVQMEKVGCSVPTDAGTVLAGLHPAAGGSGEHACSGDMLLQSLVACSGVTLAAVATAMSIAIDSAQVHATAEMDFRGTMGVDRDTPVGFTSLRLEFLIASSADDTTLAKLVQLTERYCVVLQTLAAPARLQCEWKRPA